MSVSIAKDLEELAEDNLFEYFWELFPKQGDGDGTSKKFIVGLSGGSMPTLLGPCFKKLENKVDWSRIVFIFCDERIVQFLDPESTYGQYLKEIPKLPKLTFIPIDPSLSAEVCALDYQKKLEQLTGLSYPSMPEFDLLLLGLGPDGHTCSLFPDHSVLSVSDRWVTAITDSPKPPPERVTLTLPVLNAAKNVAFITTGAGKAPVIKEILENEECKLPAALVQPETGTLMWFIDRPAAEQAKFD